MEIENIFYNKLGLPNASLQNWKEGAEALIGDEPVGFRLEHTKYSYPIIRLESEDPAAIRRVFDKAIAYSVQAEKVA